MDCVEMYMQLPEGYSRLKCKPLLTFRPMTQAEIEGLTRGTQAWFIANDGTAKRCTVNGRYQADCKQVPAKFGLYEYGKLDQSRLLVKMG